MCLQIPVLITIIVIDGKVEYEQMTTAQVHPIFHPLSSHTHYFCLPATVLALDFGK